MLKSAWATLTASGEPHLHLICILFCINSGPFVAVEGLQLIEIEKCKKDISSLKNLIIEGRQTVLR